MVCEAIICKLSLTFSKGKYLPRLQFKEWTLRPLFYTEFRYTCYEHIGWAWLDIFNRSLSVTISFTQMSVSTDSRNVDLPKNKSPCKGYPTMETLFRIYARK